jgi:hypothetical protein
VALEGGKCAVLNGFLRGQKGLAAADKRKPAKDCSRRAHITGSRWYIRSWRIAMTREHYRPMVTNL